ncbi:MAG: hypothetical protein PUB87_09610 [Eubacteriaceae bacterium]|nr:hypothetical protein [Eubacteriaceae bacterium]
MIKYNKDVLDVLHKLEQSGIETYSVGDCVRMGINGVRTYDWDFVAITSPEKLQELYPEGNLIGKAKDTLRVDFSLNDEDGSTLDIKAISSDVETELKARGFTIDAIAENPDRGFIDPFEGREDMKKKIVKTIGPAGELFTADPIKMLDAVRLAAEMGYDLHKEVFDGISENWRLLVDYDIAPIRTRLERILISDNAGKGLSIMAESGLMSVIYGEKVTKSMTRTELKEFAMLCDNIDNTHPVRLRRLGLLYTVIGKKRAFAAIDRMNFDEKTRQYLRDAVINIYKIYFLNDPVQFKRFLSEFGMEEYNYLHNLSKAQRIVYDQPSLKIEARNYYMKTIESNNEPVFIEDLVIDENDLLEAGIAKTPERARQLLGYVTSVVHYKPSDNKRDVLLKAAKKFNRNKFAALTRYVKWIR